MKWNILNTKQNIDIESCLIENRQIKNIDLFFNPVFDKYLRDPFLFTDMKKAVDRIIYAIKNNEKIVIYGDYDVDGITSATILKKAFNKIGYKNIFVFLPHRLDDGYGLNNNVIKDFHKDNVKLIITVDCGISNAEEVSLASTYGIDVIITDHHSIPNKIPSAYAIIHPYFGYPFLHLAGVGVAYKLAHGILSKYLSGFDLEFFLKWNLDIVAIGTIADIQILQDENRLFVKNGMITLKKTRNIGLKMLMECASINYDDIDLHDIGFIISPMINASGRMDDPYIAFDLLNTEDVDIAKKLSLKLKDLNILRQNILKEMIDDAINQIDKKNIPKLLILKKDDWHYGLIGLVSGKMCDMFYRPVIAFEKRDNIYVGSARSIPKYNIINAISNYNNLLLKYGGHSTAAGLSICANYFDEFCNLLSNHCINELSDIDLEPILDIDCYLTKKDINLKLIDVIEKFYPFGEGNSIPTFAISANLKNMYKVGKDKNHLKMEIDIDGLFVDAIWFNFDEGKLKNIKNDKAELAIQIIKDQWNNQVKLKFKIIDIK